MFYKGLIPTGFRAHHAKEIYVYAKGLAKQRGPLRQLVGLFMGERRRTSAQGPRPQLAHLTQSWTPALLWADGGSRSALCGLLSPDVHEGAHGV